VQVADEHDVDVDVVDVVPKLGRTPRCPAVEQQRVITLLDEITTGTPHPRPARGGFAEHGGPARRSSLFERTVAWGPVATHQLQVVLLVFGLLLGVGALLSGSRGAASCPVTALFTLVGFASHGGLDVACNFVARPIRRDLAIVALVVILFRDASRWMPRWLSAQWHLPLRKLVLAIRSRRS